MHALRNLAHENPVGFRIIIAMICIAATVAGAAVALVWHLTCDRGTTSDEIQLMVIVGGVGFAAPFFVLPWERIFGKKKPDE